MLRVIYESTIILGFTYGFYFFFLRRSRSFVFLRIFFMFAMFLSVVIPFIEVEIGSSLPLTGIVGEGKFYTIVPINGAEISRNTGHGFSLNTGLVVAYFLGLSLMLLRFSRNFFLLIRKMGHCKSIRGPHGRIILTEEESLPYSFFRNIYINQFLFEKGNEAELLLIHEGAHCKQLHSVDVLFAELLKIAFWFNPFVWFLSNAIRLNHEYLADEEVLESQNAHTYQLLLVNMEIAYQSIYLASEFNYSLTKKRLTMMNNRYKGKKGTLYKIAVVPLFLILSAILTFCEIDKVPDLGPNQTMGSNANDWWRPILEKHEITPKAYNNFEYIFEMGSSNSIDENEVVTLTDAFFLIRKDEQFYAILRSPSATHDLKTGNISGAEGILKTYDRFQEDLEPTSKMDMINFKYQLVKNEHEISADYIKWSEKGKEVMKGWSGTLEARDSLVIDRLDRS